MSNIDKQACQVSRYDLVSGYMQKWPDGEFVYHSDYQALLDELEAANKRNTELNEALKQAVSGYKSCLRTGYERILELGGDCDSPEVMIAGNPDIQHAEKLIAAASGNGE